MKCLYYLAPALESTRAISDDLHAVGVKDWYIHVIINDEAGLKKGFAETIKAMMRERHPESEYAAADKHFISPFSDVSRTNH